MIANGEAVGKHLAVGGSLTEQGCTLKKSLHISSQDPDEVEEFFSNHYAPSKITPTSPTGEIGRRGATLSLDGLRLEWSKTIGSYNVEPKIDLDANIIHFNQFGGFSVQTLRSDTRTATSDISTFVGESVSKVHTLPGSIHTVLCIHRALSNARLSLFLERRPDRPLVFKPSIELQDPNTLKFARLIESSQFNGLFEEDETPLSSQTAFSHFMFETALGLLPNNYSEILDKRAQGPSVKQVKLAVDYMHANTDRVPSSDEIASVTGVGVRALQQAFKKSFGMGIMEYHRKLRLMRAREELEAQPNKKVEVIAKGLGFTNMGRFGRDFRLLFGKTPSNLRS